MSNSHAIPARTTVTHSIYRILVAFPIAAFTLTLGTDIIYWSTGELLWLHFSEWLLLVGIVFAVLSGLTRLLDISKSGASFHWGHYVSGIAVLILATLNNFVHTEDGITAVVPYGLMLSVLTVLAMCATALMGRTGVRYA